VKASHTRKSTTNIKTGLYLSGQQAASSKDQIENHQITHVVCCYETETPPFPEKCKYLICDLEDDASEDIAAWFYETYVFISKARKENGKVLVHCAVSQSS
jgi:protein-tyrosine phosphatase